MRPKNPIISEFVEHYVQKYDFYDQLASIVAGQLRLELARRGIRAIVSSRAKDPSRLRDKLIKRSTKSDDPKTYSSLKDIEDDVVDFAGIRVALYFPGDQDKVGQTIEDLLDLSARVKTFPEAHSQPLSKGLVGYIARHYRGRVRRDGLPNSQQRYTQARVEVQVASVLMHAWAEIDHDLRYKPTQGTPSVEELATLDEVNGLVLTGEIALERLQRLIEQRVGEPGSEFRDVYELQEFLSTRSKAFDLNIGRVNLLLPLLTQAGLDTPARLQPYVERVLDEHLDEPLADSLIDAITAEDPERYRLFTAVLSEDRSPDETTADAPLAENALASFLARWIELERRLFELTGKRSSGTSARLLQPNLEKFGIPGETQEEIYRLRSIRNKLVHGQTVIPAREIQRAATRVGSVLDALPHLPPEPPDEAS
jgi:ppGpp synthetase/RelA/SpoT-type nucleotidyltranferase